MFRFIALFFLTVFPLFSLQAATLFAVVSERSAAELSAGATQFNQQHPGHRLVFRTTEQLYALSDGQLSGLIDDADAILLIAVFGDSALRLQRLLETERKKLLLAFNGDPRLTRLSGWRHHWFDQVDNATLKKIAANPAADQSAIQHLTKMKQQFPMQAEWLTARFYWQSRGSDNVAALLAWVAHQFDSSVEVVAPRPQQNVRYYQHGKVQQFEQLQLGRLPLVAILDHNTGDRAGDRALLDALCQQLQQKKMQCLAVLAQWGESSVDALARLQQFSSLSVIISLQDFVIGGGGASEQAVARLKSLNVPVIKGIRLTDRDESQWRLSEDGLPWNSVHYRVAMPEVQGVSQPMVLATAAAKQHDPLTGLQFSITQPVIKNVAQLVERAARWSVLQQKDNSEKRVAIIYYNHPPGRHNIGADNLDVPASLWELLHAMKKAGYKTGPLPESPEALLSQMQERAINLPEDQAALTEMASKVTTLAAADYESWLAKQAPALQAEMNQGPLGFLLQRLLQSMALDESALGQALLQRMHNDFVHLLEGLQHPARERALDLLSQFKRAADALLMGDEKQQQRLSQLVTALRNTGIEGFSGWGESPGRVMTHQGKFVFPGIRFGNLFIGPQPPRGWEINEELLHANTSLPPTHHYLAFYYWLQEKFRADAMIHLGRHSTYEFLPHKQVGLADDDYASLIAGSLPGIYPYIVDGVGEGIQAKRRGQAVMVDHLTPPLRSTPLYDDLLALRQLIESYEASTGRGDTPARSSAVSAIRQMIEELKMGKELQASMASELQVRGISFEQVDDEMLVHEVGHYLTKMQEQFMPLGLHVLGRQWQPEAVEMMLISMSETEQPAEQYREALSSSPRLEIASILAGLAGQFIEPSKGNDPIRTPEALPTGRNFHALDSSVLPTRLAYELGVKMAVDARKKNPSSAEGSEAVVLWASDTVRDEGAMIAFGMDMLGIRPIWNSRGILTGIERLPLDDDRTRRDTVFTTSGLFRDLYSNLLVWLDRSVLLALDGASETIIKTHPELQSALEAALQPLAEFRQPGNEVLEKNRVAAHWVSEVLEQKEQGVPLSEAGRLSALRLFGDAPGGYGAGVNRLVERSGAWQDRSEVAKVYLQRMGHAYGIGMNGVSAHRSMQRTLHRVENSYLGRSSNLYGLIDNNDAFDYLGGLSMAIESLTGQPPRNHVIEHADADNPTITPLESALLTELRGRFLNPAWLKPLMAHDYAGARTMGSEFFEYLWGWQVTNPEIIQSWVWDEVKRVYMDDGLGLGLDKFLEQGHNVHVKANMLAIMLVASHKGFWQVDEAVLQTLANQFAELVIANGLPGSGHTRPDHPMMEWIKPMLNEQHQQPFAAVLEAALGEVVTDQGEVITTLAEITAQHSQQQLEANELVSSTMSSTIRWGLLLFMILVIVSGVLYGRRGVK